MEGHIELRKLLNMIRFPGRSTAVSYPLGSNRPRAVFIFGSSNVGAKNILLQKCYRAI